MYTATRQVLVHKGVPLVTNVHIKHSACIYNIVCYNIKHYAVEESL